MNTSATMTYKLRVYVQAGVNIGDVDHEESFSDCQRILDRYWELYKRELWSLNPSILYSNDNSKTWRLYNHADRTMGRSDMLDF